MTKNDEKNGEFVIQMDFLRSDTECELMEMRKRVEEVRKSSDNVRKGTYSRLNELKKECEELRIRLAILEKHICKGDVK